MLKLFPVHKIIAALCICYSILLLIFLFAFNSGPLQLVDSIFTTISGFTIVSLSLFVIANYGWRYIWKKFPILGKTIFPDLNGEWEMTIKYNHKDGSGVKLATAILKQSLLEISMQVISDDSSSQTLVAMPIIEMPDKIPGLYYVFRVTPEHCDQKKYEAYDGFAKLSFGLKEKNSLSGNYYTSSQSFGHFSLTPK